MSMSNQNPQLTPLQAAAVKRKLAEAEIIARAWGDEAFRVKLESDPAATLNEMGFPTPEGKIVKLVKETPGVLEIVLPPLPKAATELDEAELEAVSGGAFVGGGKCELAEKVAGNFQQGGVQGVARGIFGSIELFLGAMGGRSTLWD